jgi:hypothetical protein
MTRTISVLLLGLCVSLICVLDANGAPITIPVNCGGMQVGTISVQEDFPGTVKGTFTSNAPTFPTLADAARQCGEHHFNWYQVVVSDNLKPLDAAGIPVTPPYVDPPPGGYLDDNPTTPGNQTQPADNLPWYWNEGPVPAAGSPQHDYHVASRTTATTLDFEDAPGGLGATVLFKTWLVSLNADSSFHSFHPGFTWDFRTNLRGTERDSVVGPIPTSVNPGGVPTPAEYKNIVAGFQTSVVPEPGTLSLLGGGALLLLGYRGRNGRTPP